jgi:inositol transport system ATP-binding protein
MEQIRRLNIKTPTMDQIINNLSGGNQQKSDCPLAVSAAENINSR